MCTVSIRSIPFYSALFKRLSSTSATRKDGLNRRQKTPQHTLKHPLHLTERGRYIHIHKEYELLCVYITEPLNTLAQVQATLASLLQDDFSETTDPSLIDKAWRGAEVTIQ